MDRRKTCFVVMPDGVKSYAGGEMNFDHVYDEYVAKGAGLAGYKPDRADRSNEGGVISERMMELIYHCPLAVVDITTNNPNVFYELGVRHALHKRGTVLIRRKGSGNDQVSALSSRREDIPFNIRSMKVFDYELDEKGNLLTKPETLAEQIIAAAKGTRTDSLPYVHLPELRIDIRKKPAKGSPRTVRYGLPNRPSATIGYRTGDIEKVTDIDFWVNSENVMMQMARFYEQSISSTIRHLGAWQPDPAKEKFDDTIAKALLSALGNRPYANDAEVIVTDSGRLAKTHNVKKILHVATARGYPGKGWVPLEPVGLLGECVKHVICEARELVRRPEDPVAGRSILIPLLGTGQARGEPDRICGILLEAAIEALRETLPDAAGRDIDDVLFLAFSESDEQMLDRILDNLEKEETIVPRVT
jgi:hypothetical protein